MFKIVVYAIMRNEEKNLLEWINQFAGKVDKIVLLDTGSTDKTYDIAQDVQENSENKILDLHRAIIDPFDFSVARNMALSIAQKHSDSNTLLIWADLDERFCDDWYQRLAGLIIDNDININRPVVFRTTMNFEKRNGIAVNSYPQHKIHTYQGFEWQYACHEILMQAKQTEVIQTSITVDHDQQPKERNYLPLLKSQYEKTPTDLRAVHYYARELYYQGQYDKADQVLVVNQCITMNTLSQVVDSYLLKSDILQMLDKDLAEVSAPVYAALSIHPSSVECDVRLAELCWFYQDIAGCFYWASKGIGDIDKENYHQNVIYNKIRDIEWRLYDFSALSLSEFKDHAQSLQINVDILNNFENVMPSEDIDRIKGNIKWLLSQVTKGTPNEDES